MTSREAELLQLLVEDLYGDVPAAVFGHLCSFPRITLQTLARDCDVDPPFVRPALALLIKLDLVACYPLLDEGMTFYEANLAHAYALVRGGRYLQILQSRGIGSDTQTSFEELLGRGRATQTQFTSNESHFFTLAPPLADVDSDNDETKLASHEVLSYHNDERHDTYVQRLRLFRAVPQTDFTAIVERKMAMDNPKDFGPPVSGPVKKVKIAQQRSLRKRNIRDRNVCLKEPPQKDGYQFNKEQPHNAAVPPQQFKGKPVKVMEQQRHFLPLIISTKDLKQAEDTALKYRDLPVDPPSPQRTSRGLHWSTSSFQTFLQSSPPAPLTNGHHVRPPAQRKENSTASKKRKLADVDTSISKKQRASKRTRVVQSDEEEEDIPQTNGIDHAAQHGDDDGDHDDDNDDNIHNEIETNEDFVAFEVDSDAAEIDEEELNRRKKGMPKCMERRFPFGLNIAPPSGQPKHERKAQHRRYQPSIAAHSNPEKRQDITGYSSTIQHATTYWNPVREDDSLRSFPFTDADKEHLFVVDHEKMTVRLRTDALTQFCLARLGTAPALVYQSCLRFLEKKIPRCFDPYDTPSQGSGPTTAAELVARSESNETLFLGPAGSKLDPGARHDVGPVEYLRDDEFGQVARNRMHSKLASSPSVSVCDILEAIPTETDLHPFVPKIKVEAFESDDEESKGIKVGKEKTSAPKAAKEPSKEPSKEALSAASRLEALCEVLKVLAQSPDGFLFPTDSLTPRQADGEKYVLYKVDFEGVVRRLAQHEMECYASARVAPRAGRVVRALTSLGKLDERALANTCMVPVKTLRELLSPLQALSFIDVQEVPKDKWRVPTRAFHLFAWDFDRARRNICEDVYKMMARLLQHLKHVRRDNRALLDKASRSDVVGNELERLRPLERDQLRRVERTERMVWTELVRLDEVVLRLRDFLPAMHPE